ncbi:hypothetical protein FB451DRAFT_1227609 [Mycena latifolia]|nr:hypothetical protein FB451DRAFT_1227609 [Mycena latifolia]
MSVACLGKLPPELILLLPPYIWTASLNAVLLTSRRRREILQHELVLRLTPELSASSPGGRQSHTSYQSYSLRLLTQP